MNIFSTVALLIVSNIFMTFAWYGHLKLEEMKVISNWPLYGVILVSWLLAMFEYSFKNQAKKKGENGNGGPVTLMKIKIIQEVKTLIILTQCTEVCYKGESLQWNQFAEVGCLILAVYFVFMK